MAILSETISFDNLSERVFEILKSRGYMLKMFQENGEVAFDPSTEARKFFVEDEGMMVAINEDGENSELKIYISDTSKLKEIRPILNSLRQTASLFGINYNLRKYNKTLQPKEFAFMSYKVKKEEKDEMNEAKGDTKLVGTSRSSSQKRGPAKIIVRHKTRIDDSKHAARSRNIDKIFIETAEGERLKFPVNWLQGARSMARHISEGGDWHDPIGSHIKEQSVSFKELKEFIKANNKGLNEESSATVELVKEHVNSIVKEIKSLQGPKSYRKFVEVFDLNKPTEEILDEELNSVREMFNIVDDNENSNKTVKSIAKIRKSRPTEIMKPPHPESKVETMESPKGVMGDFTAWLREDGFDPSEQEIDRTFENAIERAEQFIESQTAQYTETEIHNQFSTVEEISDFLHDLEGDAWGAMRAQMDMELTEEEYSKAFKTALNNTQFGKMLIAKSNIDTTKMTNDLIATPDLKNKMQDDPEAVINKYRR